MGRVRADWPHEIVTGPPCLFCGETPRSVVVFREPQEESATREPATRTGVCESCAVEAYWAWKNEVRDVPAPLVLQPTGEPRPKTLRVLLLRLAASWLGEEPPSPLVPYSYQLAVKVSGEVSELPTTELGASESDYDAAARVLEPHGIVTWEPFVELLYDAYSARGELTRLVLCTAWARDPERRSGASRGLDWRDWPPWVAAPASAGLYSALRSVILLRLARYEAEEPRPPALSVELREVAVKYVVTQQRVRRGEKNVDASMLEYSRNTMTEFERRAATRVREAEELGATALRELAEAAAAAKAAQGSPARVEDPSRSPTRESPAVPEAPPESEPKVAGKPGTLAEAFGEEVGGDGAGRWSNGIDGENDAGDDED